MWREPKPGKSLASTSRVSTLSMLEMVTVQILNLQRRMTSSSATYGGHTWVSLIFPSPHSVYVINIIILLLLVHQFAGLCIQQKQMGNICPGRPALPPGPRITCARSFVGTPVMALLLYADKPYFSGCRSQQGPGVGFQAWLRSGSEGTRMRVWWETGIQDTRPCLGHLRDSWQGLPVFLLSRCPSLPPAVLLSFEKQ